jgi:subtilisin family serine protease
MSGTQIRSMQAQGIREIIVKRQPGLSATQESELRAKAGITYVGPGPLPDTELDQAPAGGLAAAVAALRSEGEVRYAEPNGVVEVTAAPTDPYFSQQWALLNTGQSVLGVRGTPGDDIGATSAWSRSTGANVTVAVVDSGVDWGAADLQGQLVAGASFFGGVQGTSTQDLNGHGTHVTGIIAAAQNNGTGVTGVAPGAKVMPLQVVNSSGTADVSDVAAAFNYAGQQNVSIVNASLGSPSPYQALTDAVTSHPNTLYVVAAGNGGTNNDSTPFYPCDIPAANLICVGASDQNDQPASFSNYGAANVDLFAPGVNIVSTYPNPYPALPYGYMSGTSMSTPMVSGTLALMLAANPSLNASQLKAYLLASVKPQPQLAGLSVSGGELDAGAAVGAVAPAPAPAPPTAPAPAPVTVAQPAQTSNPPAVSLSHVAVRGGGNNASLVFTLSGQARVQINVSGPPRARLASATSVGGHRGTNRYTLSRLLHGRRLQRGRYTLRVRAGRQTVIITLKVV